MNILKRVFNIFHKNKHMTSYTFETYYQDEKWFERNENNFEDLPQCFKDKYINFSGNIVSNLDFIRFGKLNTDENGLKYVEMPIGFNFYHASRSLGLSHDNYPVFNDSKCDEKDSSNYKNFFSDIPWKKPKCTNISYYGNPSDIVEYLLKPYSEEVKDAYRQLPNDIDNTGGKKIKANRRDYPEGIYAYKTNTFIKLIILNFDNIRGKENFVNYGRENTKIFQNLLINNKELFKERFEISEDVFEFILHSFKISGGTGDLSDLIVFFVLFDHYFKKTITLSEKEIEEIYTKKNLLSSKVVFDKITFLVDNIIEQSEFGKSFFASNKTFKKLLKSALKVVETKDSPEAIEEFLRLPSFRFSTYELDRIFINSIKFLLELLNIKYDGMISTSTYNFVKPYFHPEMILFNPPNVSMRNMNNPHDISYKISPHNIVQEFRKYRSSNVGVFHEGHLFEHSSWTAIRAVDVYRNFNIREKASDISEFLVALSGFFHDIGKAGDCEYKHTEYFDLDYRDVRVSECRKDGTHFLYFAIPDHPEKGYKYLNRDLDFFIYENITKKKSPILNILKDISSLNEFEVTPYDMKLLKISVACHYMFGYYFLPKYTNKYFTKYIPKFIERLEFYINYEFPDANNKEYERILYDALYLTFCVSIGDLLASKYKEDLKDLEDYRIYNELPNVKHSFGKYIGNKEEVEKNIFISEEELVKRCSFIVETITKTIENNKISSIKINNYALLKNMLDTNQVSSLYSMFPSYCPQVIAFDLDETTFSSSIKDGQIVYNYFKNTIDFIDQLQELRKFGVKLAIVSRHYFPNRLLEEKEFLDKFDIITSIYTGENDKVYQDMKKYAGSLIEDQNDIIMIDNKTYHRPRDESESKFVDDDGQIFEIDLKLLKTMNKSLHIDIIRKILGKDKSQRIFLYDDDNNYIQKRYIQNDVKVIAAKKGFLPFTGFCLCLYESILENNKLFAKRRIDLS